MGNNGFNDPALDAAGYKITENSMLFYSPTGAAWSSIGTTNLTGGAFYFRPLPGPGTGTPLAITPSGLLVQNTSSKRFKDNITPMDIASEKLLKLEPVTFSYKHDTDKHRCYGLIAEEVEKILPGLVTYNAEGEIHGIKYNDLSPILLHAFQKQQSYFAAYKAEQEEQYNALKKEIEELKKK